MKECRLLYQTRQKENKTDVEKLMLLYYNVLTIISSILVDESKLHISKELALEKIHEAMSERNKADNILEGLEELE